MDFISIVNTSNFGYTFYCDDVNEACEMAKSIGHIKKHPKKFRVITDELKDKPGIQEIIAAGDKGHIVWMMDSFRGDQLADYMAGKITLKEPKYVLIKQGPEEKSL